MLSGFQCDIQSFDKKLVFATSVFNTIERFIKEIEFKKKGSKAD